MASKKGSAITIILILAGLIFLAIISIQYLQSKYGATTSEKTLQLVKQQFRFQADIVKSSSYWTDENGKNTPLTGYEISLSLNPKNGYMTREELMSWESPSDKFFSDKGFSKDKINTLRREPSHMSFGNGTMDSRLAYVKNDFKCITFLDTGSDNYLSFFCGSIDAEALARNNEFSDLIPVKLGYKDISVQKVSGNFAKGAFFVYGTPTSIDWIAVKENGKWTNISGGQNLPSCKTMAKYSVPQEIYDKCTNEY